MMLVSLIIPCFNAIDKIGRCLASLEQVRFIENQYEVLIIDDCSNDGTDSFVRKECSKKDNWHFFRLETNSGSPSMPRNIGIKHARGKYVYFLDCDDEILPDALNDLYNLAVKEDACLVRSALLADDGKNRMLMNQLPDWSFGLTLKQRIEMIISKQSTVVTNFVKRELLVENNIRWPEHLRMGEDTVFLAEVMVAAERIEYLNKPTFVYFKLPSLTPASTQRYGKKELSDHLNVWSKAQLLLNKKGINYIEKRIHIGLKVALEFLIYRNRGDVDQESFNALFDFIRGHWSIIKSISLSKRLKELLSAVYEGDYISFRELAKPRLLIAGHDLKFISDAFPELERYFTIRTDVWSGHAIHDEKNSQDCLEWADYIWCEWLLGNAEWYARHKQPCQRLVVRMHRMELGRDHGTRIDINKVDGVIAVSTFFFERLLEKFPNIPREKAKLIHNYVRVDGYDKTWHADRLFTVGIIGILPCRKGFKRALEILNKLKHIDARFNLKVFGKVAEDLHWVANNSTEMKYFSECREYIDKNNLSESVDFVGHVDIKTELARHRVGYVLSVSDPEFDFPGPESFHLAVADGFSAGCVSLLLHWQGCEYIWPKSAILESVNEIVNEILYLKESKDEFFRRARDGESFIKKWYDIDCFVEKVKDLFLELS